MRNPWLIVAGLFAALVAARLYPATGDELVTNGGFESGSSGWTATYGDLATVASPVHSGAAAGQLAGSTLQPHEAYQWLDVAGGATYQLSGWVLLDDPAVDRIFLRIRWVDGSGSPLSDDTSAWLTSNAPAYQNLSMGALLSPGQARSARVGVVVQPALPQAFSVYLDDFTFSGPAPPSPTPTVAPTPLPTQPPSPTATPPAGQPSPSPAPPAPAGKPPAPEPAAEPSVYQSLTNGGFEQAREDGTPLGWRKVGGEMARSSRSHSEGQWSATFTSGSESTKWLYQTVSVTGGRYYELRAQALKSDPGIREAFLRLSWYASADGSGSAAATDDSTTVLADAEPGFRALSTGPVQAPAGARSAKVRLMLRPASAAAATAYFDAVSFGPVPAPAVEVAAGRENPETGAVGSAGGDTAAKSGAPRAAALDASSAPAAALANVRPTAPEAAAQPAMDGAGRPAWPLALALALPACGLALVAGVDWRRRRLAGREEPNL